MSSSSSKNLNAVDTVSVFGFKKSVNNFDLNERESSTEKVEYFLPHQSVAVENKLKIEHSSYTDIESVGLQVWSGAFLLADYIVHHGKELFSHKTVLELAAGVGLCSIISSMYCDRIICTDVNDTKLMETIHTNFDYNKHLVKANVLIKELNFYNEWGADIQKLITETDIVLVSEVIYDDEITDAFVDELIKIFNYKPEIKVYMTLEKRYVFTLFNLCTEAKYYEYFFRQLKVKTSAKNWNIDQIEINFPQYFKDYERTKELELWKIWQR